MLAIAGHRHHPDAAVRNHFYEDLARDVVGFLHGRRASAMDPVRRRAF